jgi:hypothetical protein
MSPPFLVPSLPFIPSPPWGRGGELGWQGQVRGGEEARIRGKEGEEGGARTLVARVGHRSDEWVTDQNSQGFHKPGQSEVHRLLAGEGEGMWHWSPDVLTLDTGQDGRGVRRSC